jgi:hypothetical protein
VDRKRTTMIPGGTDIEEAEQILKKTGDKK